MNEFPKDANGNPSHHQCYDCGYIWRHGQHGGHDCVSRLKGQLIAATKANTELQERVESWRAWVAQIIGFDHVTTAKTDQDMREDIDKDLAAWLARLNELEKQARDVVDRYLDRQ